METANGAATAGITEEEEAAHQICKNCGYHDASGEDAPKCPACYFRHASLPVHQALGSGKAPENSAEPGDKPVITEDAGTGEAISAEGQAAQVTIVVGAEAPTEANAETPIEEEGKSVEEKV